VSNTKVQGYDVIGDIHGCATELEALLDELGYAPDGVDGAYRHPERKAVFVGDLIDRGPEQLRVLEIVKAMVDAGAARMVLGNHEFNAMAYATEWPAGSGKYLRPHDDPSNPKAAKNENQHKAFLDQVTGTNREHYLAWFWTQPLWLNLGDLRVVHACWHSESIAVVERELGRSRFTKVDQLVRASTEGDPLYTAVETLLKGPEISLVDHDQEPYIDKDGAFARPCAASVVARRNSDVVPPCRDGREVFHCRGTAVPAVAGHGGFRRSPDVRLHRAGAGVLRALLAQRYSDAPARLDGLHRVRRLQRGQGRRAHGVLLVWGESHPARALCVGCLADDS